MLLLFFSPNNPSCDRRPKVCSSMSNCQLLATMSHEQSVQGNGSQESWPSDLQNYLQAIWRQQREVTINSKALDILMSGDLDGMNIQELVSAIEVQKERLLHLKNEYFSDKAALKAFRITVAFQKLMLDKVRGRDWYLRDSFHEGHEALCRIANKLLILSEQRKKRDSLREGLESEVNKLQSNLKSLRARLTQLTEKMQEIEAHRKEQHIRPNSELLEDLKHAQQNLEEINYVFQRLVQATGVDFAQDIQLWSTIHALGKDRASLSAEVSRWKTPP